MDPIIDEPRISDSGSEVAQRDFDLFDYEKNLCVISVGKSNSGKTNLVRFWIDKGLSQGRYKVGICFSPNAGGVNNDWSFIPQKSVFVSYHDEILKTYIKYLDFIKEKTGEYPLNFIIFEDMIGQLNNPNGSWYQSWLSRYRHWNSDLFFCVQRVKGAVPLIRSQITHAFLFKVTEKLDLDGLYDGFGSVYGSQKRFKIALFRLTNERYHCALFDKDELFNCHYDEEKDEIIVSPFLMSEFVTPPYKVGTYKKYAIE